MSKLLKWPNNKPFDADNSLVYVIDKSNTSMPIQDEYITSHYTLLSPIIYYFIAWIIIMYFVWDKSHTNAYIIGFTVGVFLLFTRIWFTYNRTDLVVYGKKPYIHNFPTVKKYINVETNNIDYKEHIDLNKGHGDYKILLENNYFPKQDNKGYIISAKNFLDLEKNKKIESMNMIDYVNSSEYIHNNENKSPNIQLNNNLIYSTSYILTIIITWGLILSEGKPPHYIQIVWIILVILIGCFGNYIYTIPRSFTQANTYIHFYILYLIFLISVTTSALLI